jgi:hypothetical protein
MSTNIFKTADVLSVSTGRLLGDVDGLYKVMSFLLGRDAYTHELAYYGERASLALIFAVPGLPGKLQAKNVTSENYREWLLHWTDQFGATITLPDSLRDVLADDRDALSTLSEMVPASKIKVIKI